MLHVPIAPFLYCVRLVCCFMRLLTYHFCRSSYRSMVWLDIAQDVVYDDTVIEDLHRTTTIAFPKQKVKSTTDLIVKATSLKPMDVTDTKGDYKRECSLI